MDEGPRFDCARAHGQGFGMNSQDGPISVTSTRDVGILRHPCHPFSSCADERHGVPLIMNHGWIYVNIPPAARFHVALVKVSRPRSEHDPAAPGPWVWT